MSGIGYVAAVALALTFAWAAAAKLRNPVQTAVTFRALRLPRASALSRLVPASELLIAAALLVVPPVGATLALVALAFFTTLIVGRLRAGAQVSCGCFGTASAQPISFVEPLRNGLLAGAAVAALFATGPTAPDLSELMTASTALLIGALVLALAATKRDAGAVWRTTLAGSGSGRAAS
jgi:hypothetical protein